MDRLKRWILKILSAIDAALDWLAKSYVSRTVQSVSALLGPIILPTRAVLLPILLCGFALGFTDQGVNWRAPLPLDPTADTGHWLLAFTIAIGTLTWWAIQSWWWARILLERRFGVAPLVTKRNRSRLEEWTPRLYAMAVYSIAIIPLAFDRRFAGIAMLVGVALLVLLFLKVRSRLFGGALSAPLSQGSQAHGIKAFQDFTKPGLVMLALNMLIPLLMVFLLTFWRTEVTFFLGTLAVAFIAMSCILPVPAVLMINQRGSGAPIFAVLLLYAAVVTFFNNLGGWDNHTIRAMESALPEQFKVEDAYAQWRDKNGADSRIVLVYSAGGGLRAAYWTSALLSELEKRVPGFHCKVFAVSGVSGGSVGAVFWAGALQATAKTGGGDPCRESAAIDGKVNASLARDYLASGLSGLLFNDLLAAFVPFKPWWNDRAVALEQSWEAGFEDVFKADTLADSFHDLWRNADKVGWMPVLLLNGTHQETGQRIITSNVLITDQQFPKAYDFFATFEREIAASTAALNSARFTYVSPAGRLVDTAGEDQGHVIDGGYFENYGARTISDLYAVLINIDPSIVQRVLLVEMINDTDLKNPDADRCAHLEPGKPDDIWTGTVNEIVAPIKGMLMARQARGVVDARMAANRISPTLCDLENNPRYFQLRLCAGMNPSPPLGWVMGEQTVDNIGKLIAGTFADPKADPKSETLGACANDLRKRLDDLATAVREPAEPGGAAPSAP